MKNLKNTMLVFMMIFMIGIPYFFPLLQSFANENVDVNVLPSPTIDIVLAKSKTTVDVNNFEEDLKKELIKQNISPERVNIKAVEAVEANIQDSFDWEIDVSSAIGSIDITNHGQNIVMKGNKKNPGKNAMWIIPEKEQEQDIKFDYSVDFGDSFNAAGMLLRVKRTNNTLTGYMLSLNKSGKTWYTTAGKKYGAIWKFTYELGTNSKNMTKTFVKGLDINTSGTLTIKSTSTEIIISGGGLTSPIHYRMDTDYGYGFGFFSDHYSHNCSKIGAFTLGNIRLTTTTVKKFKEVLSNPEWREDSLRFLVNVDDYENEELKNKSEFASVQAGLINEQIHPIFWGTAENKEQSEKVIQANHDHGTFIDNTNYANAIEATVTYIKSLIDASKSSQYALIHEPVELKVTPESAKNNTISEAYPQGKWKINHDYEYFENNLGQMKNSGKYMSDLSLSFDKTGRYELLYEDGNIASKYIYVHRKPVANFQVSQTNGNVTLTSTSYDLDNYSNNHGISQEEWKYKEVNETNWHSGKLVHINPDETYIIQLSVKDFQETWSTPVTKYVMYNNTQTDSIPVASFTIKNPTSSKYEPLTVENSSYDPAGLAITDTVWKVKKDGNVFYTGKTPLTDYSNYPTGSYTMSLVVTNELGKKSEEFSRIFQLVDDTIPPEVTATPSNTPWTNQPVTVALSFSDKGGSKFKGYQYTITDSKEASTSWSEMISKETDSITIDTEGEKYLHIIGQDNAGNVSEERIFGPYNIDLSKPEIDSIVPENKDWTNESIAIHATFSDKGGSGFSGYQYAITTEQTAPQTWSEIVKEDKATFTISGEAEYYLHLKIYDMAGNENVYGYGPYQMDKTSPKAEVTPAFCDWTNQPVTIKVTLTDEGGSALQNYQYAITNSGIMPDTWENEITGEPQPIILDKEGEHYLHLVGKDNAGNTSSDHIFGKYKLDFTLPELIFDDITHSNSPVTSLKFTAKDDLSGICKFTVNGSEVIGTEYVATSNGDYTFEIVDYAGNVLTKTVSLTDLYSICNKGLEHPPYRPLYQNCPICDLIDGIKVTSDTKTYEGKPISISYDNTKNSELVTYYNDSFDLPVTVGAYPYELKIVYNGEEYSTGIKNTFTICKKPVDILGLKLEDKIDDGTTTVNIDKTNLNLAGIVASDKDFIELEMVDTTEYDISTPGDKTVILQKDIDYHLKLKETVDSSHEELIDFYELPETLAVTGKLLANESTIPDKNVDSSNNSKDPNSSVSKEESTETDTAKSENSLISDKKTIHKFMKDNLSGKLLHTGRTIGSSLIVVAGFVVIFNMVSGRLLVVKKRSRKRNPRIFEKVVKK